MFFIHIGQNTDRHLCTLSPTLMASVVSMFKSFSVYYFDKIQCITYLSTKLQKINELKSGTFFGLLDQPALKQNSMWLCCLQSL